MAAGDFIQGRRREDTRFGHTPEDPQPGDYWKYLGTVGEPTNLTGTVWGFRSPNGFGIGTLMKHTVRENEDGTATIAPDDGSSNSVLINDGQGHQWHGYLDAGVWRSVD